jgi:hypothetical protein
MLSKCDCQRCGNPIEFPTELHNTETSCPHCGKATTLNAVRAVPPAPTAGPAPKRNYTALGVVGILTAIFLPIIGFFIGIYLLAKGQSARGCICLGLSILAGLGWFAFMNS